MAKSKAAAKARATQIDKPSGGAVWPTAAVDPFAGIGRLIGSAAYLALRLPADLLPGRDDSARKSNA